MQMEIYYKRRHYGTGGNVANYTVMFRSNQLSYVKPSTGDFPDFELKPAIAIYFKFSDTTCGLGEDWGGEQAPAEVKGGDLAMSRDAARDLANGILRFLAETENSGEPKTEVIYIRE